MYRELAGLLLFNSEGYTFRLNLLLIFGALWRYNIEVSVTLRITDNLPASYREVPTVGLLAKTCRQSVGQQLVDSRAIVGQQSTNRRLTGYFGSCSSQLPHFLVMGAIFSLVLAFLTSVGSVSNMSFLLLTQVSIHFQSGTSVFNISRLGFKHVFFALNTGLHTRKSVC